MKGKTGSRIQVPSSKRKPACHALNRQPLTVNRKLILFTEYFPFMAGGQRVLLSIINYMKDKYDVRVLIFNRGMIEKELKKMKVRFDYLQAPKTIKYRYFWSMMPFSSRLHDYLFSLRPALIYNSGFFAQKLTAPVADVLGIPAIWHKHQIIDRPFESYRGSQVKKYGRTAAKVICVSDASRESMKQAGIDPAKLVTVRNGIVPVSSAFGARRSAIWRMFGIKKNDFVAGYIGYFRRNKGVDIMLKAAALVKDRIPGFSLLLVGKAEDDVRYDAEIKALVREHSLEKTVVFAGEKKAADYLPAFDVFAIASIKEPFALAILEAMSAGLAVAAFRSGGTPEMVKDGVTGFLADEISAKGMADALLRAYKNRKKLKSMGKTAMAVIKKDFTIKRQMDKIGKVIEDVVSRSRAL